MRLTAEGWRTVFRSFAAKIAQQSAYLTELDAAIGDADHGSGMERGAQATLAALPVEGDAAAVLKAAAMSFIGKVGGASGPLYGTAFLRMSSALTDKDEPTREDLLSALEAGYKGLVERGKAEPGDKTMLDAWFPALEGLRAGGSLQNAAQAARQGRDATAPLVARKGRASYLGERSAGHIDPGAASSALFWDALAESLEGA